MKFIFTADIHLKLWSDTAFDENGLPLKLTEILGTIRQMCDYGRANGIDTIVIGGDLNDTKGTVAVRAFVKFNQLVDEYSDFKFYILHGNHDSAGSATAACEESAVELAGTEHKNVFHITEATELHGCALVPYSSHISEDIQKFKTKILISHFGLTEGQLASGLSIRTSIGAVALRNFELVLLGHYHKPQCIETSASKIYYVGSPIPLRRDEHMDEKRFLVVDTDTLSVESVPTEGYRKYRQFVLTDETAEEVLAEISALRDSGTVDHLTVRSEVKRVSDATAEVLSAVGATVVDAYEEEIVTRGIDDTMSESDKMKKFVEIEAIAAEDVADYLSVGLECVALSMGSG